MVILSFAIILAMVLFLIDRNHAWPQTWRLSKRLFKVGGVLLVLGLIGLGILEKTLDYQNKKAAEKAVPKGSPVDCYDSQGNLLPDMSKAFGGFTVGCAPGETAKPVTERGHIPTARRQRAERVEACEKDAADKNEDKAAFDKCQQ